jgi:hypothetical protein
VPTHERLGPDDCENLQDCWEPAIQLTSDLVREPDATMRPAPQDNQLMAKHRVLRFKPQLRHEWRCEDGQSETEQPNHAGRLGDSITASTRMRLSIHTGGDGGRRGPQNILSNTRGHRPYNPWRPTLAAATLEAANGMTSHSKTCYFVKCLARRWPETPSSATLRAISLTFAMGDDQFTISLLDHFLKF